MLAHGSRHPKVGGAARHCFLIGLIGLAALAAAPRARAQAYIRIDKFSQEKYSLAIPPLYDRSAPPQPATGERLERRLFWAVDFTSLFKRLERASFLENPASGGWTAEQIRFADWAILDALGLIKGWYQVSGKTLEMELNLFDVFQQRKILGRKYKGSLEAVESMIDAFANDLLEALTGVKGSFGTRLAFVRRVKNRNARETNKELFVIDLDGRNLQKVTSSSTPTLSPSWSRDGKQIVFIKYPSVDPTRPQPPAPFLLNLREKTVRPVARFPFMANSPRFSPIEDEIAISLSREGNEELYLMSLSGQLLRRLTYNPGIDVSPSFSPDGKELAFSSDRSGQTHIYKMSLAGGEPQRLTYNGTDNGMPA